MLRFLRNFFGRKAATDSGDAGERLAAEWLQRERGFRIVARNWRSPRDRRDEIDLVARDGDVLVFVEVKARGAGALVPGYYAVNGRKKRVVRRAAEAYLAGLRARPRTIRFDVVEIVWASGAAAKVANGSTGDSDPGKPEILHFENVPLFAKHFRG